MKKLPKSKTYEEFVEKFKPKPKLTTDDCYTPPSVYAVIRDWACKEYGIDPAKIVRPFYPGGDYENYEYPEGAAVLDNPPFSILAKICAFYLRTNEFCDQLRRGHYSADRALADKADK